MTGNNLNSIPIAILIGAIAPVAQAEVKEVTFAHQHGLTYLSFMVMNEQDLVEKNCKEAGLDVAARYIAMGGAAPINDAIVSERAQVGAVGPPSLVQLWSKTKGSLGVKTIGSMSSMPMFLNTNRVDLKSISEFKETDKIALPSVKVSVQAVTLQMAVAQLYGKDQYAKLDKSTISMPHPDALIALTSGGASGITAHWTGPPFQYQELKKPGISKVISSYDVLGGKSTFVLAVATEKFRRDNPKTFNAVVKALSTAQEWIGTHKEEAADLYLKYTKSKEKREDILAMLNDPEIEFTIVPANIHKYATFMHEVDPKNIKNAPTDWKELCFDFLHDKNGS